MMPDKTDMIDFGIVVLICLIAPSYVTLADMYLDFAQVAQTSQPSLIS
jgi:hypothetical protein